MRKEKVRLLSRFMGILLMIVLIGTGLLACVGTGTTGSQQNPTPTAQAQNCGTIRLGPNGKLLSTGTSLQAGDCFWQHFQQCQAATVTLTVTSIDTILTRIFTIEKTSNKCVVSETTQHEIVPNPPRTTSTSICTGMIKGNNALHITACKPGGNVVIPLSS